MFQTLSIFLDVQSPTSASINVTITGSDADFTVDKPVLCSGDTAQLTDLTNFCPTSWSWEFSPNNVIYLLGTNQNSQNPTVMFTQNGAYTVTLTAGNSTGTSSITKEDYIMNGGYLLPFTDDFEEGFGSQFWTIENPDQRMTWDTISVPGTTADNKAAWMNFYNYVYMHKRDQLISPVLDLTNYNNIVLTFRHAYAQRDVLKDSLIILVSDDCGGSWNRIFAIGPDGTPNTFVTHEPTMDAFFPESENDWCGGSYGIGCYTLDLNAYAGKGDVKIAFESYNRRGNNLFLDDITITGTVGIPGSIHGENNIRIYPNPTTGMVNLVIDNLEGPAMLMIYNLQGQVVLTEQIKSANGAVNTKLNITSMARGIYYLKVITNHATFVEKIIKE